MRERESESERMRSFLTRMCSIFARICSFLTRMCSILARMCSFVTRMCSFVTRMCSLSESKTCQESDSLRSFEFLYIPHAARIECVCVRVIRVGVMV